MTNLRPDLPDDASVRNGTPLSSHDHPRNDVASSVRDVIHLLVTKEIPDEVLEAEAVAIAESADRLRDAAIEGKRPRDTSPVITDHPQDFFPFGPTTGRANPMALPIDIWAVNTETYPEIRGQAVFTETYEGPPTCVHGGIISLIFDELLGNASLIAGVPAMTGTLTIRYKKPTPLLHKLDLMAKMVRVEGRKAHVYGSISLDGEVTAEAEGIFVVVPHERMIDNAERHSARVAQERTES